MVQINPDVLARNPSWGPILNGAQQIQSVPNVAQGQVMPASSSLGTIPVTTNNLPYPAANSTQGGNPLQAGWEAQQNLWNAQQTEINLKRSAVPLVNQHREAEGVVDAAKQKDVDANRALLNEQLRAAQAKMAEDEAIMSAQNNTENIIAVGRAKRERQQYAPRLRIAGLDAPIELDLPDGFDGTLPPGVVQRLQTIAEKLQDKQADAELKRKFNVELARIHADNTGLDVTEAQIRSGKIKVRLEEIEQAIELAGLDTIQARIALEASDLPPQPGLVYDQTTMSWTTPIQKSVNETLARDKAMDAARGSGLVNVPIDTLMSMASQQNPVITDDELVGALVAKGVDTHTANLYLNLAKERRKDEGNSVLAQFFAANPQLQQAWNNMYGTN